MPEITVDTAKEKATERLYGLLKLQGELTRLFGEDGYNVFIFGSYITIHFVEGESDIDIAIYAEDFELYKKVSMYLEEYFAGQGIKSDIFFIDTSMAAPIYCAPLKSKVQLTGYFPRKLLDFQRACQDKLDEIKWRTAV